MQTKQGWNGKRQQDIQSCAFKSTNCVVVAVCLLSKGKNNDNIDHLLSEITDENGPAGYSVFIIF